MQVFITGGTGFVGSGVVRELLAAGHVVTGLARTPESAENLTRAGVTPRRGDLSDLPGLRAAAAEADAVVHCGFVHDFANFAASVQTDLLPVEAMTEALASAGGDKVFVCTSGAVAVPGGRVATEADNADPQSPTAHRAPAEAVTRAAAARGVRSAVLRLPPSVHGPGDHGFVPILADLARKTGVAACVGAGDNRWPAVHRDDAAALYRLAVEKLADGSVPAGSNLHAVGDPGVPFREIATALAERLRLGPPQSRGPDHFGWFARFAAMDLPMSAAVTERQTGWRPTRPGLLADLRGPAYDPLFAAGGR